MTKDCENCGKPFEAKRKTARYCSTKCRVAANRPVIVDPKDVLVIPDEDIYKLSESSLKNSTGSLGKLTVGIDPAKPGGDKTVEEPYDREANVKAFEKMGMVKTEWITTGIPELDDFQQIPRGRVTQIQGPFAVGKTTLALNMIKGLTHKKVFYIDTEASLNPDLLGDLGVNAKRFRLYNESAYLEDIYDQVIKAAKDGSYDMIILDSLAACTTRTEEVNDASSRNIGQKALIVNKLMRIVPMYLKNLDTALVIINQEREVIGSYVPQKYTPGGMGPVYAASLILGLKTIPSWRFPKDAKEGAFEGHEIEVKILKSKVSRPHRTAKIKLYYVNPEAEIKPMKNDIKIKEKF